VRRAFFGVALLSALTPRAALADGEVFGLSVSVARDASGPVRDDAWIEAQIAGANVAFAPAGVGFRGVYEKELAREHAELHTRADRDALAVLSEARSVVDVFVVAVLEDVDEPGRMRKGVAWTHRPDGRRYVVISAIAPPRVLAHELGHFFGNPHTAQADNLMSYERTGGPVAFDEAQISKIRMFSGRFLATGRLVDVGVPRLLF
jgi:hypothetical protein